MHILVNYSQIWYHIILPVLQIKPYSMLLRGYHMFQLKENNYIFCKFHKRTAWSDEILIILTAIKIYLIKVYHNFPADFSPVYIYGLNADFFDFLMLMDALAFI